MDIQVGLKTTALTLFLNLFFYDLPAAACEGVLLIRRRSYLAPSQILRNLVDTFTFTEVTTQPGAALIEFSWKLSVAKTLVTVYDPTLGITTV